MKDVPGPFVRIRAYPEGRFVSLWLCCRPKGGGAESLLWGELLPETAEALVALLGLPVEREESPCPGAEPITPPGCADVARQLEMFGEAP